MKIAKALLLSILWLIPSFAITVAAESVQVVSDLGDFEASLSYSQSGDGESILNLSLPVIGLADANDVPGTYKRVSLPAGDHLFSGETGEVGKADMPLLTTFLAIPDEAAVTLDVTFEGYETISDIVIVPVGAEIEEGSTEEIPPVEDSAFYAQDAFYPEQLAEVSTPAILRDIRLAQITLAPVQYNPVRRELRIYRGLSVRPNFAPGGENPKRRHASYLSEGFSPIYRALLPNFDEIAQNLEIKRGGYLILTKPIFVDSLRALAIWKHRKGYPVRIVPTTEINSNGNPTAGQIFNYLQDAYETWEVPPEYVMIVGDADNLTNTGIAMYPYDSYSSDHRYSQVDGSDFLPDIMVGRLSVDNMTDLRKALAKVLAYDRDPNMDDPEHWVRGLCVGGNVGATTPRITVLWVRQLLLGLGFTQVDTSFSWTSGGRDPLLPGYFNQGISIVAYRGWSGSSGWYSPSFNVNDLNVLENNNKLGFMSSGSCGTGDFGDAYSDPCFGETWIRMGASTTALKGGPAFYGTTDHSGHTKWNNPMMIGYMWGMLYGDASHFGAAMIASKMQLYRTFPRYTAPGQTVQKYFNTFNLLGDPEAEFRTKIPLGLIVNHPQALPLGINLAEIAVTDSVGSPVEGAFVTLVKGYGANEEVFEVRKTDVSGRLAITFAATTSDTMFVTVSGRNLYPYRGQIMITQTGRAVSLDSAAVDDDTLGLSSGNGDGLAGPGETIEIRPTMKNFGTGQTARDVRVTMQAIDSNLATVFDSIADFGDILPGQIRGPDRPFVVGIDPGAHYGDRFNLRLVTIDGDHYEWQSALELQVAAPAFEVGSIVFYDGNNRLDPGDSVTMVITLRNVGNVLASGVTASISTINDYATVLGGNVAFGDIAPGDSASNSGSPITVIVDADIFNGSQVTFAVNIALEGGARAGTTFEAPVSVITFTDPTGPDLYGYYMYDNTDNAYPPRPLYQWVEVATPQGGNGTRLDFAQNDDYSVMIELPFDFVYYGEACRKIIVTLNGVISTDTTRFDMEGHFWYNFYNWPIPDPATARAQISAFWDDIAFTASPNGVYTWFDSLNHSFAIEWYHMYHRNTSAIETFEMILYDPAFHPTITGDAEIVFLYQTINNNDDTENYSSVGFESSDQTMGIQYEYDNFYAPGASSLTGTRAIKITTNTGRGGIKGTVDLGGANVGAVVSTNTGQSKVTSENGAYWIKDVPPGEISLTCETRGYFPQTINPVTVTANVTTDSLDFALTRCPIPGNLQASDNIGGHIEIAWSPVAHAALNGYDLFRSRWQNGVFDKLNEFSLPDTVYYDFTLPDSGTYWYYVTAVYENNGWTAVSFESNKDSGHLTGPVGIEDEESPLPRAFFLSQNYPNPFNPSTAITYGLPQACRVRLEIYDISGRRVSLLSDKDEQAGFKTVVWDGKNDLGSRVASGIYFVRLVTPEYQESRKMVLVR